MVKIRMARQGAKKRPFYHIVVSDVRKKRDGGYIEKIGFFNPLARGGEERLRLDLEKVNYWVDNGAETSERVRSLIKEVQATTAEASHFRVGELDHRR